MPVPKAAVRPLNLARRAEAGAPPRGSHRARAAVSGQWERRGAWSGRHLPRSHSRDRRQEGNADWLSKAKEESGSGVSLSIINPYLLCQSVNIQPLLAVSVCQ